MAWSYRRDSADEIYADASGPAVVDGQRQPDVPPIPYPPIGGGGGEVPLTFAQSVKRQVDGVTITLLNDVAAPGNSMLYGTSSAGVKGWFVQPAGGGTGAVNSVFTRAGDVVALAGDYAAFYQPLSGNLTSWAAKTPYVGTLSIISGKTFAVSNTITLVGVDGSTLAIGSGGTLGTAAFTAASTYEVPLTFPTSVARTVNNVNLVNDLATPGGSKYYGTSAGGTKGWNTLAMTALTDGQATLDSISANATDIANMSFSDISGTLTESQLPGSVAFTDPAEGGFLFFDEAQGKTLALKTLPITISGTVNDWNPTAGGIHWQYVSATDPGAFTIEVNGGGSDATVTGLAGGYVGRLARIRNTGTTNDVIIANQNNGSVITNRFGLSASQDMRIRSTQSAVFVYSSRSRWERFEGAGVSTGVAGLATSISVTNANLTILADGRVSVATSGTGGSVGKRPVGFTLGGAGTPIPTGKVAGWYNAANAGTISGFNVMIDTGSVTIQTAKIAAGSAVPVFPTHSISNSGIVFTAGSTIHSTSLGDFNNLVVAANDIFAFNIAAVSGTTDLAFNLEIT